MKDNKLLHWLDNRIYNSPWDNDHNNMDISASIGHLSPACYCYLIYHAYTETEKRTGKSISI